MNVFPAIWEVWWEKKQKQGNSQIAFFNLSHSEFVKTAPAHSQYWSKIEVGDEQLFLAYFFCEFKDGKIHIKHGLEEEFSALFILCDRWGGCKIRNLPGETREFEY